MLHHNNTLNANAPRLVSTFVETCLHFIAMSHLCLVAKSGLSVCCGILMRLFFSTRLTLTILSRFTPCTFTNVFCSNTCLVILSGSDYFFIWAHLDFTIPGTISDSRWFTIHYNVAFEYCKQCDAIFNPFPPTRHHKNVLKSKHDVTWSILHFLSFPSQNDYGQLLAAPALQIPAQMHSWVLWSPSSLKITTLSWLLPDVCRFRVSSSSLLHMKRLEPSLSRWLF